MIDLATEMEKVGEKDRRLSLADLCYDHLILNMIKATILSIHPGVRLRI